MKTQGSDGFFNPSDERKLSGNGFYQIDDDFRDDLGEVMLASQDSTLMDVVVKAYD